MSVVYKISNKLDPSNPDIDDDVPTDGEEIEIGTIPKNSNTESNDIIDGNDSEQTVSSSYKEEELGSDTKNSENYNGNDNPFCFTSSFVTLIL